MGERLPFTGWSKSRIAQGRKWATSRTRVWDDDRVVAIVWLRLDFVRDHLYQIEGADSPEEFEQVWRSIHRGHYKGSNLVCVHFGDFREVEPA